MHRGHLPFASLNDLTMLVSSYYIKFIFQIAIKIFKIIFSHARFLSFVLSFERPLICKTAEITFHVFFFFTTLLYFCIEILAYLGFILM